MFAKCIDYVKKNPLSSIVSFFVLVLAYGFYATKYTINYDQLVSSYYDGNILITAGRWSAPLIHWVTNWMEFSPFWHTLLMMSFLWISGLCWIVLFKRISNDNINSKALLSFWLIYPVFPLIIEQLTYPILNIALAYILIPISIWMIYPIIFNNEKNTKNLLLSLILMTISVDMYESFVAVFLVGISAIFIFEYLFSDKFTYKPYRYLIVSMLKCLCFILVVILVDFAVSKLLCYLFSGTFKFWYSSNTTIYWFKYGTILDGIIWFIRWEIAHYVIFSAGNLSIFLFDVMTIISIIYSIVLSIKKHSFLPFIICVISVFSSISLSFVLCTVQFYRMEQAIPVFVSIIWMLLVNFMDNKKNISIVVSVFTALMVLSETQTINNYSVQNYEIYEYQYRWMCNIGDELEKYDTENKAVAFVQNDNAKLLPDSLRIPTKSSNPFYKAYRILACDFWDTILPKRYFEDINTIHSDYNDIQIEDTDSLIQSFKSTNTNIKSYMYSLNYNVYRLADGYVAMKHLGYNYIPCTKEQYEEAKKYLKPDDSSCKFLITETDDMIVVQLMSCD